jgi:hypothetical protein
VLDSIYKIVITYEIGHSDWGEPGVYSKVEKIEITKPRNNENNWDGRFFYIEKYKSKKNNSYGSDTISNKFGRKISIHASDIVRLLSSLGNYKDNFTTAFIQPYFSKVTNSEIRSIAEKYKIRQNSIDDYIKEGASKIEMLKEFYLLDSFIEGQRKWLRVPMATMDSWNICNIDIIKQVDSLKYWSEISQPLGQPFAIKTNIGYRYITNLEINLALNRIFPKGSILYGKINFNSLKEMYIKWYLENNF